MNASASRCACSTEAGPPAEPVEERLAQLKALADPVRWRIVELIHSHGGDLCACDIERHFDLSQPTISHHLKVLRKAGLLGSRQVGTWVHHRIEPDSFLNLAALINRFSAA